MDLGWPKQPELQQWLQAYVVGQHAEATLAGPNGPTDVGNRLALREQAAVGEGAYKALLEALRLPIWRAYSVTRRRYFPGDDDLWVDVCLGILQWLAGRFVVHGEVPTEAEMLKRVVGMTRDKHIAERKRAQAEELPPDDRLDGAGVHGTNIDQFIADEAKRECYHRLPAELRMYYLLHEWGKLTGQEIAAVLQVSPPTVSRRLATAAQEMAACLGIRNEGTRNAAVAHERTGGGDQHA